MSYQNLLVEGGEGIATVTINRPDKLNALDDRTVEHRLGRVEADDDALRRPARELAREVAGAAGDVEHGVLGPAVGRPHEQRERGREAATRARPLDAEAREVDAEGGKVRGASRSPRPWRNSSRACGSS